MTPRFTRMAISLFQRSLGAIGKQFSNNLLGIHVSKMRAPSIVALAVGRFRKSKQMFRVGLGVLDLATFLNLKPFLRSALRFELGHDDVFQAKLRKRCSYLANKAVSTVSCCLLSFRFPSRAFYFQPLNFLKGIFR